MRGSLKRQNPDDDIPAMRTPWRQLVLDRLTSGRDARGGFGYRPSALAMPEPSSFACIALLAHDHESDLVGQSLDRLCGWQVDSGAVLISSETPSATWPTAIAAIAWAASGRRQYDSNLDTAIDYLLGNKGKTFPSDPRVYGHDTELVGWPWIEQTHTWLEPTSYALLALRAAGRMDHPRAEEAIRVIYNREIPSGGWNYGNGRMFSNELRSFPSTTGMVLAALSGHTRDATISRAIDYLHAELPEVRSFFSLAWGVIGLGCWDAVPAQASAWMERAIAEDRAAPPSPLEDALMLIAIADDNPFAMQRPSRRTSVENAGVTHG